MSIKKTDDESTIEATAASGVDRRSFFRRTAGAVAGTAALGGGLFQGLVARQAQAFSGAARGRSLGYGPLSPAGNELALPPGFQYSVVSLEGTRMADGYPAPKAMDGMAAFPLPNGNVLLVRNHEDREEPRSLRPRPSGSSTTDGYAHGLLGTHFGPRSFAYDTWAAGGCTSLEVEPHGRRRLVREWWSLVGTAVNCAGGPTPWGSWITCEETAYGPDAWQANHSASTGWAQRHGYCFEVPVTDDESKAGGPGRPANAVPLRQLGRFAHEAVAVDPATGTIYETEDQGDVSGFYRFVPDTVPTAPGQLASITGRLQMLKVVGVNQARLMVGQTPGAPIPCEWVDIPNPDAAPFLNSDRSINRSGVFDQGFNIGSGGKRGAAFRRLEGCWYAAGKIYFQSTNGGDFGFGQVWTYTPDPDDNDKGTLQLLVESNHPNVFDGPDNICVSPRGGLVVCEDGSNAQFLRGISPTGEVFDFARNLHNSIEFAGACFSPDGQTLFVNILGRGSIRNTLPFGAPIRWPVGAPRPTFPIPPLPVPTSWYPTTYEPEHNDKAMTLAIWGPWRSGLL